MAEYPRTVMEFRDWFADEAACRDYLVRLRWPEGFCCPVCSGADHWVTERGLRHCRGCSRQTSVTAGTLFADTHLPLRLWFEALWQAVDPSPVPANAIRRGQRPTENQPIDAP